MLLLLGKPEAIRKYIKEMLPDISNVYVEIKVVFDWR